MKSETNSAHQNISSLAGLAWPVTSGTCRQGFSAEWWCLFAVVFCLVVGTARGQGNFTALQTGGGQPLVSDVQVLQIGGISSPELLFEFGFLTDEAAVPGVFLDSFTVTIQDAAATTAVLATIDASGSVWTPTSPGAIPLSESDLFWQPIMPPSQQPVLSRGVAYSVQVPIPEQFSGSSLTVYFDLFDNLDSVMSVGWYRDLQVAAVPEPRVSLFLFLGWVIFMFTNFRRRVRP